MSDNSYDDILCPICNESMLLTIHGNVLNLKYICSNNHGVFCYSYAITILSMTKPHWALTFFAPNDFNYIYENIVLEGPLFPVDKNLGRNIAKLVLLQ